MSLHNMQYIDTHAHLNLTAFKDDALVVAERCAAEGVVVINVGTKESTSARAVELASLADNCYAIIGLHPIHTVPGTHDEEEIGEGGVPFKSLGEEFATEYYRTLAENKKVVGIGECGFDYYRTSESRGSGFSAHMTERARVESDAHYRTSESRGSGFSAHMTERARVESKAQWHTAPDSYETQEQAFIAQIQLANELRLPLMIHTRGPQKGQASPTGRSVYRDVYEVLNQYAKVPFNVHFYAGTYEEATRFFEIGGTVSFTGVITFAKDYEELVKNAPLDRIHAETDCPYVAPVPYRGERAEPWMVQEVYKKIAAIKGLEVEAVQTQLVQNAVRQYGLSL